MQTYMHLEDSQNACTFTFCGSNLLVQMKFLFWLGIQELSKGDTVKYERFIQRYRFLYDKNTGSANQFIDR